MLTILSFMICLLGIQLHVNIGAAIVAIRFYLGNGPAMGTEAVIPCDQTHFSGINLLLKIKRVFKRRKYNFSSVTNPLVKINVRFKEPIL